MDTYRDNRFRPLRFIPTELRALAEALKQADYQEAEILEAGQMHVQAIEDEIERYVRDAAPGDHLLLVLSGHGFHHDGTDYLVTGPALYDSRRFHSHCLRIEFGTFLRASYAAQLVVAVDACRDPLETYTKSVGDALAWGHGDTGYDGHDAAEPRYAHLYACARYGTAGYGFAAEPGEPGHPPGDEKDTGFSYFTRALTELAGDTSAPGTLAALEPHLDARVRTIARQDRGHSDQGVQITYATGKDGLVLFPARGAAAARRRTGEHPWEKEARGHEAWRRVRAGKLSDTERDEAVEQVRAAVARLAGHWGHETDEADAWLERHGDVWRPAGCESRMERFVGTMLHGTTGPARDLSLTEAALLVLGPYLFTAFGTRLAYLARDLRPWTLEEGPGADTDCGFATRGAFERYCSGHRALQDRERRARQRGREDEARAVAWWLSRQWLLRLPATRDAVRRSGIAGLDLLPEEPEFAPPLVGHVLDPARLWRLVELIGLDLERTGTAEPDTVAAAYAHEHTVDWGRIATLLTIAHHMAVDPVLLPSLVAEHLGISAPVDGTAFRAALRTLTWQPDGPRRVLSAQCPHEAVELALHQHTEALDRTVRALQARPDGTDLTAWGVPTGFGSGRVAAAPGADGRPRYDAADVRFRLDGDRVRDLLMGEQLYRDRTLALRELYQNALDACRYRRARTQLWNRRRPEDRVDWQGEIEFGQGVDDDGRAYIECRDNGIGMGRNELRRLFAFAGNRFVEEREFLGEWAEWDEAGIEFHPNSRFGVGVLSYFMLADEIRVSTVRLGREMTVGERLIVHIDGPGALFRIQSAGPAVRAGTAVRLYLRDPAEKISCGEVLRRQLWVSDFDVTVREEGREELRWRAGELSAYVGPDRADSLTRSWHSPDGDTVAPYNAGDGVWWCPGGGAVLADGLWAGEDRFGVVVNLTGKHAPTLTVDRTAMLDDHEEFVSRLLTAKIPALFEEDARVLSLEWLQALMLGGWAHEGRRLPVGQAPDALQGLLADRIAQQVVARGTRLPLRTRSGAVLPVDPAAVGCCPADKWLVEQHPPTGAGEVVTEDQDALGEWRARVWAAADPGSGVRAPQLLGGRPTDDLLLEYVGEENELLPGALVATVRRSGLPFDYVVDRLRDLGVSLPEQAHLERLAAALASDGEVPRSLAKMLSRDADALPPWFRPGEEVNAEYLSVDGCDPRTAAPLVAALGFRVPSEQALDAWLRDSRSLRRRVLRRKLRPGGADLPRDQPVPLAHLVLAAKVFPGRANQIAEALRAAGHRLPPLPLPQHADPADLRLLSLYGNGDPPWRTVGEAPPLHHVFSVSRSTGLTADDLVRRLARLGFTPPELPASEGREVYERLNHFLETRYGYESGRPLPGSAVVTLAAEYDISEADVVGHLKTLGYLVHDLDDHPRRPDDYTDLVLLSRHYNGTEPWLDAGRQVPWHHVLRAAARTRRPHGDITAALSRYGYEVAPEPLRGNWTPAEDLALLCLIQHGLTTGRWLPADKPVPLTHILYTAHRLSRTPHEVARRLEQFGHRLPEDVEFKETATRSGHAPPTVK
ncbi:wHTH domain-containing protein [Streptomyces sp. enrichment culture]|uniref:wHTH domain-containing protein n=1 Tax=Streptomyces sp. enrichment culture TaxID=1795815 RepID=UPI003F56EB14